MLTAQADVLSKLAEHFHKFFERGNAGIVALFEGDRMLPRSVRDRNVVLRDVGSDNIRRGIGRQIEKAKISDRLFHSPGIRRIDLRSID